MTPATDPTGAALAPEAAPPASGRGALLLLALAAAALCSALATVLLLRQLDAIGLTWDEYVDIRIALDILYRRSVLLNVEVPSQGRLNHLIGVAGIVAGGRSLFAFKLAFVIVGVAGVIYLYVRLRQETSTETAFVFASLLLSNPYFLGTARTGATGGDVLSMTSWIFFLGLVTRADESGRLATTRRAAAIACGLAIGAKLTNAVLAAVAPVAFVAARDFTRVHVTAFVRQYAVFLVVALGAAVLAHPLLLLGPETWRAMLSDGAGWETAPERFLLQEWHSSTPLAYVAAIALAKLSPPFVALLLVLGADQIARVVSGRHATRLVGLSVLLLAMASGFALKHFQNAQYYVIALGPVYFFGAAAFEQVRRTGAPWLRRCCLVLIFATLAYQARSLLDLRPDFLQAGRELGLRMQGEFSGPAVNHCQGGPLLVEELNAMRAQAGVKTAGFLVDCYPPVIFAENLQTVVPEVDLTMLQMDGLQDLPDVVVVSRGFLVSPRTRADETARKAALETVRARCTPHPWAYPMFEIYVCAKASPHARR